MCTVESESRFSLEFETLTDCSMDVFLLTPGEKRTYDRMFREGEGKSPSEMREQTRSFVRKNVPEDHRFFGAESGSTVTQLPTGPQFIQFQRACELGSRTAVEFTAEIGDGDFEG